MKTFSQGVPFFALTSFCLIVFLFCLDFGVPGHFKIIICIVKSLITTWRIFCWNVTEKRKPEKYFLGAQTGLSVSQTAWIHHWCIYRHIKFFLLENSFNPPAIAPSPPLPLLSLLRKQCSECLERLKELLPGLWYVRGWSTQADTK